MEELLTQTVINEVPPGDDFFKTKQVDDPHRIQVLREIEASEISSSHPNTKGGQLTAVLQTIKNSPKITDLVHQKMQDVELAGAKKKRGKRADDTDKEIVSERGREIQPTRARKQNDPDRLYDGTQLHAAHHGYFVHRDYAAHFFRWGFVSRRIKPGNRVLDVGCGQDLPLARVISAPGIFQTCSPSRVVCVDWNKIETSFSPKWLEVYPEFDFIAKYKSLVGSILQDGSYVEIEDSKFDTIVCFEVIEHMDVQQGSALLSAIKQCMKADGLLYISTPVFNGSAAANHIHEYTIQELHESLTLAGFTCVERYGTFASINDIKKVATQEELDLVDKLRVWYGNDVVSCFLAPLYPNNSRNNCWVCMHTENFEKLKRNSDG